jgi:hypothetical protein
VYDLRFWENTDSGVWDAYHKTWRVDYNATLRMLMRPNDEGDYDVELIFDPYMVRVAWGDSAQFQDGVTEYGHYGADSLGQQIVTKVDLLITAPHGYWDPPVQTSHGSRRYIGLLGGAAVGDYSVLIDFWNSGNDEWVSDTLHFYFEDPCSPNPDEGGYLVDNGLVTSRSEFFLTNPSEDIIHYTGTVRYYVSDREPQSTDTIEVSQVYEMVKGGDSTYGSPYHYAPINLLSTKLEGYGKQTCWPGDCSVQYSSDHKWSTSILVEASALNGTDCDGLLLESEFVVAPMATTTSGVSAFDLGLTSNGDSLRPPETVVGTIGTVSGSSDYFIVPDQPFMVGILTAEVCVQPQTYVAISQFDAIARSGSVELSWRVETDEEIAGYRIYRRTSGESEARLIAGRDIVRPMVSEYADHSVKPGQIYDYWLTVEKADGSEVRSMERSVELPLASLALYQNNPNPFNPATRILFTVPRPTRATLSIFDAAGRHVRTLVDEPVESGINEAIWDGKDTRGHRVGSGVYFYRLIAGKKMLTKKMVLLK